MPGGGGLLYRLEILRLPVRDLYAWQGAPTRIFFGCLLRKLLRVSLPPIYWYSWAATEIRDAPIQSLKSADVASSMVSEAQPMGFDLVAYLRHPAIGPVEAQTAVLLSSDRRSIALCCGTVIDPLVRGLPPSDRSFACISRLSEGREIVTLNTRPLAPTPPFVDVARHPGLGIADAFRRHVERLSGQDVQLFDGSREGVLAHCANATRSRIAFLLESGLLEPASASDLEALRRAKGREPTMPGRP